MVIKCSFLVPRESIGDCATSLADLPPSPEYIVKMGPYVNNKEGGVQQIIILYKFDKTKFVEAWENISKRLGSFGSFSGFTVSAHIYGPRPYHLILEKEKEIKKYPSMGLTETPPPVLKPAYEY